MFFRQMRSYESWGVFLFEFFDILLLDFFLGRILVYCYVILVVFLVNYGIWKELNYLVFIILLMEFSIIGSGYVGMIIVVCFVEFGYDVVNVDIDEDIVVLFNDGQVLIYEFGLVEFVEWYVGD